MKSPKILFLALLLLLPLSSLLAAEWTFMVYLDGDNNLEENAIKDINEMETIGSDANMNIVVIFDRISGYDNSNGNWTDTRRGLIIADSDENNISSSLTSVGEKNMGDPGTLAEFVNWAVANYPANHYALVLWNHGDGWRDTLKKYLESLKSSSQISKTKGEIEEQISQIKDEILKEQILKQVCYDNTSGDGLYTQELRLALESVSTNMDIIVFDACLMQMMEVAYEICSHGTVMVGSEQSVPLDGFPYDLILGDLKTTPSLSPQAFSSAMVQCYGESYQGGYTLAGVDLSKMGDLASALSDFADAMIKADTEWSAFIGARMNAGYYTDTNYRDLQGFLEGMIERTSDSTVLAAANQAKSVFVSSVIANHSSYYEKAHGLSVYLSSIGEAPLPYYSDAYIVFAAVTLWDDMLKAAESKTIPDDSLEPFYGLCCLNDDWYKFYIPENGAATISVFFDHDMGDLDLELYDSLGTLKSSSENTDNFEFICFKPPAPGYYFLRVFGYGGDTNYYYDLNIFNPDSDPKYRLIPADYEFIDYSQATLAELKDDDFINVDIGFPFEFFDQVYTSVSISSNGYLTFGAMGMEYINSPVPVPMAPNALIAPFWDDLVPHPSKGGVFYETRETKCGGQFIVSWVEYLGWDSYFGFTPNGATFQVVLCEDDRSIQFNYQDVLFSDSDYDNGASATVGLEDETGTKSSLYSYNENVLSNELSLRFAPLDFKDAKTSWCLY